MRPRRSSERGRPNSKGGGGWTQTAARPVAVYARHLQALPRPRLCLEE